MFHIIKKLSKKKAKRDINKEKIDVYSQRLY